MIRLCPGLDALRQIAGSSAASSIVATGCVSTFAVTDAVGSGLNAHPEYHKRMVRRLSELTGLQLYESDDLFESMQSMADAAAFSASLRTLALTLIRIANDFRLLASGPSTGLDEIRLPAVQPGSSILPGKVNPSIPEMVNQVCQQVIGCDAAILSATEAGQLQGAVPEEGHGLDDERPGRWRRPAA